MRRFELFRLVAALLIVLKTAEGSCDQKWKRKESLGKCIVEVKMEFCYDMSHGEQYRAYMKDPAGLKGYSGYQESENIAHQQVILDYRSRPQNCISSAALFASTANFRANCSFVSEHSLMNKDNCTVTRRLEYCAPEWRAWIHDSKGRYAVSDFRLSPSDAETSVWNAFVDIQPSCVSEAESFRVVS